MAVKSKAQQEFQSTLLLALVGIFFVVLLFTTFWIARPEVLVKAYTSVRALQFGTLWDDLFPQARALIAESERGIFRLGTFVKSSIPSAVLAAVGILTLGLIAYNKVSSEHLDRFITHKSPPSMMQILEKFAIFKPAVRFVLDYKDHKLSSAKGDGRLPYHPLHFLHEHGFIKRIGKPSEWQDANVNKDFPEALHFAYLEVDKDQVQQYFSGTFGPVNPFIGLKSLNDIDAVRKAVDAVPFYMVLVMAPALARIHHSIFYEEKAYVRSVLDLHKFPDEVWSELNAMRKAEGERLRLGFDDEKHRTSENSLWHEKMSQSKKKGKKSGPVKDLVTLREYLNEMIVVDGVEVLRGDAMKSVKKARELMWDVLTVHRLEERRRWPVGQDNKGNFVWKDSPATTPSERAYLDKVTERLVRASETCHGLMKTNAYCFGLMGALVERTREMGVYTPNVWRWMRFVEIAHWRFLLDLGKPISSVDAMGMWEHFNAEKAIGGPIHSPFLRRTANDLARQAARFVTKEFIAGFKRSNVMSDTGNIVDLEAIYREVAKAEASKQAEESAHKAALNVGEMLTNFDPAAATAAAGKPINFKKADRRIVS